MKTISKLHLKAKKAWQRTRKRAIILLYHRVAELDVDPQLLAVTPQHFAEHLDCLRKNYYPMDLKALKQCLENKRLPHKSVVITFDDGYKDNLDNAKPILAAFDIPATVYMTGGKIDSQKEFWVDELERIFRTSKVLPEVLELTIKGRPYKWMLAPEDQKGKRWEEWNVRMNCRPTLRQKAYCDLARMLKDLREREHILEFLRKWSGIEQKARQNYLPLTSHGLQSLADGGLVQIGSHGFTHTVLSSLDSATQEQEIMKSGKKLESILGQPITTFSYPFGSINDYNEKTISILKSAGYQCACSNFFGWALPQIDFFQMPRCIVRDWNGEEFSNKINRFFSG